MENLKKNWQTSLQEEVNDAINSCIRSLNEQMNYVMGDNPDKVYGYPQTYNKEGGENEIDVNDGIY